MALSIKAENISKVYRLGEIGTGTISRDIERWFAKIRGKEDPFLKIGEDENSALWGKNDTIWSLNDINFEINQGDTVGLIGRNGAGKSTLLKILSRVTAPSKGEIKVKGRIASLLEVGTGFHPELTGRENIFLNGAILGMRKWEIAKKFDEIVAFAEVERYVDTPVKRYSSGMYVRLAFAVAAHLDSEILVVDEVLAVGDAEFQKKCLSKMGDVSKSEGRTILFVSHNLHSINTLTNNCMLLDAGKLLHYGETNKIINFYNDLNKSKELVYTSAPDKTRPKITKVKLNTSLPNNVHCNGEDLVVEVEVVVPKKIKAAWLWVRIKDSNEIIIIQIWTSHHDQPLFNHPGIYLVKCSLPNCKLFMGNYSFDFCISGPPGGQFYEYIQSICPLEVVMYNNHREWPWRSNECAYLAESTWEIKKEEYKPALHKV
ncbi:ATP-binding cassette domain-containing protein [Antarcticibacterium flavum]|uniref:ATP-binding cassette domain-containing protein n=1 Tax=Antarcticibacterium flavum TaxID=2058175 RepID=A0A5B7X044_9FLAO|nr:MULTISPECIES: polysaccharide ABC transporter ATP-binding protein [Antarcticibacterium]MCM4160812.1 ABC transporter ATP-binding protein [Antarcticibacterium sp. W02-3]QCY67981.1 ATP-binding cassette domain-containing protein [Antarcticibacterium flavum]